MPASSRHAVRRLTAPLAAAALAMVSGLAGSATASGNAGATARETTHVAQGSTGAATHTAGPVDRPAKPGKKPSMGKATSWKPVDGTKANPARWDRCTPIVWKADFSTVVRQHAKAAPELARWRAAFAAIAAETGYTFRYGGTGVYRIRDKEATGAERGVDIVISYGTSRDRQGYREPTFTGHYGIWGWGGSESTWDQPVRGGGEANRLGNGSVIINAIAVAMEQDPRTRERHTSTDLLRSLYLHEMGHAMNLQHVTDRLQMMYANVQSRVPSRYGAGDRAGLRNMGRRPCFVPEADTPQGPEPPDDEDSDGVCSASDDDPDCPPGGDDSCEAGDPDCYDGYCDAADPTDPDCTDDPDECLPADPSCDPDVADPADPARHARPLDPVSHNPPAGGPRVRRSITAGKA
jgi:hypothetical protein